MMKVYSPAHISTIFLPYMDQYCLERSGSRGTGITLEEGMTSSVELKKESKKLIVFSNGEKYSSPSTIEIFDIMANGYGAVIKHNAKLPFESGNGNSAAMTLNTAYAIYHMLSLKEFAPVLKRAHVTEVRLGTGLGDVGPMFCGLGIDLRKEYGFGGYSSMEKIDYKNGDILCFYLGKMNTKKVINGNTGKIKLSAERELKKLEKTPIFENFIECSKRFAKDSWLMPKGLEKILSNFDEASMIMLGNAGFIFGGEREYEKLLSLGVPKEDIIKTKVSKKGTSIVK